MLKRILSVLLIVISASCTVKLAAQQLEWGVSFGGASMDLVNDVASDKAGNMYAVGNFLSTIIDIDPGTGTFELQSQGGADIFITKLDAAGNFVWGTSVGGLNQQHAYGIVIDDSNYLYITGHFQGLVDFDPSPSSVFYMTPVSAGSTSMFLLKLDSAGSFIWAKEMGVLNAGVFGGASGRSIAIDPDGNLLITGEFTGTIDFDPGPQRATVTSGSGIPEIFVAKYSSNGAYIWVDSFDGGKGVGNMGYAVQSDALGNVYVTGSFRDTVDFDPGAGTRKLFSASEGIKDIFLCKLGPDGSFRWAFAMGSIEDDYGEALVVDDSANVYITGRFQYTVDFDPGSAGTANRTASGTDIFLCKYDSAGLYKWAHRIGSAGVDIGQSLAIDIGGNIYLGGAYSGTVDFDPGGNTASLTVAGSGYELFISKYDRNGGHMWVTGSGSGSGHVTALEMGRNGDLYAGGNVTGAGNITVGVASVPLAGAGNTDVFLLRLACDQKSAPATLNAVTCDVYAYNNNVYDKSGSYRHLFRNMYGCDSVVTLDLEVRVVEAQITVSEDTLATIGSYASYRWLLNGDTIPGAVHPTHIAVENGDYQVVVTDADGCSDTSNVYAVNNVSVHDSRSTFSQVKVYPNPAHDVLHVVSPASGGRVVLYNLAGKQVVRSPLPASVNLKGLAHGMYLLMVYNQEDHLIHTTKVVKQ